MKQNYRSMTILKKHDVTIMSSMYQSHLILKISFLTLFGCVVKIKLCINPIFGRPCPNFLFLNQQAYIGYYDKMQNLDFGPTHQTGGA